MFFLFQLVSITEVLALHSCKEIKKYCKTAISGFYWIGGKDMTEKKYVYCDMETDEGKWYKITLYSLCTTYTVHDPIGVTRFLISSSLCKYFSLLLLVHTYITKWAHGVKTTLQ